MFDHKPAAPLFAALLLAGCASTAGDSYPSLAVRDVEPAAPRQLDVPPVAIDAEGDIPVRLESLVAAARDAHEQFTAAVPAAQRRVQAAGNAAVGSDSWASAQVALADLDSARSNAAVALGDLDILFTAATVQAQDTAAIAAARATVVALVTEEDVVLERLRAQVR